MENESDDTHNSRECAEAICRRLEREGFGGDGLIFPLSTRVEEVPTPTPTSAQCDSFNRARGAIFEIEESLPYDDDTRRAFYRARIALIEAWNLLENSV